MKELYEEIKKLAGDKFVAGKIYKFETCIMPPDNINNSNPKFFRSKIKEVIPTSYYELEEIGEDIPLQFK